MQEGQHRKRSRRACETCRDLKRKCDGAHPCGTCIRFEYDCAFSEDSARRGSKAARRELATSPTAGLEPLATPIEILTPVPTPEEHLRSLEANSGAAFVRRLAIEIDPHDVARVQLFAWNAFLGSREAAFAPNPRAITDILSRADMESLATVYFDKIDPCYGFIDRGSFDSKVCRRWAAPGAEDAYDAVLCGVAALGYLFSRIEPVAEEIDLLEAAKTMLEQSMLADPSITNITAWVLRVAYMRLESTPHATWMASGILMHMVEAAGLHHELTTESILHSPKEEVDPEIRRRLFGVARHLNIWVSFDMARSRVALHGSTTLPPTAQPGNFTHQLVQLLPYSVMLGPEKSSEARELESMVVAVLDQLGTRPMYIVARCNLMLCICRRLKSLNVILKGHVLDRVLGLIADAIRLSQTMVDAGTPWHHMAHVPFHSICILLVVDSPSSIALIKDAMQCLSSIVAKFNTEATQEALRTASLLILKHQRRKEKAVSILAEILKLYPAAGPVNGSDASAPDQAEDFGWLDTLTVDMLGVESFELDHFLGQGFPWDGGSAGF
ncbi:hypothetical protein GQ53DRAFT_675367 [Thozetella sp. PMI_491]|nr:hypothetical protein GQ53DRAFT_675367 [Thozetella sp. PMI_491]